MAVAWLRWRPCISMQRFTTLQQRYKVGDPLLPGLGFFSGGNAKEEAVALGFVQLFRVLKNAWASGSRSSAVRKLWLATRLDAHIVIISPIKI